MGTRAAGTLVALAVLALGPVAGAADVNPHLAPLLGKTLPGVVSPPGAANPAVDIQRFEPALGGQAVRNSHSVNHGAYGGEAFIVWDEEKQSLVSYYFTTAGFYTVGTLTVEDGAFVFHQVVKGSAGGVTEVKATSRLLPDGRLLVKSQHLKDGKWQDPRETYYVEEPQAVVRFKE